MSDRSEIEQAIRDSGGTITNGKISGGSLERAARKLGVARKTLYNRMKVLGLRGTSGRPKRKFGKRARNYAVAATAAVALVGGAVLLRKST